MEVQAVLNSSVSSSDEMKLQTVGRGIAELADNWRAP